MAHRHRGFLCRQEPPAAACRPCQGDRRLRSAARGFLRRHRRHGDGCRCRHPGAGLGDARSLLRSRRKRGRPPLGARLRRAARPKARGSRIISAAPFSSPIFCATSTKTRRSSRLYLPREALHAAGIKATTPRRGSRQPTARRSLRSGHCPGARAFCRSRKDHGAMPAPERACAAADGRSLPGDSCGRGGARLCSAARESAGAPAALSSCLAAPRPHLMPAKDPHHRRGPRRPRSGAPARRRIATHRALRSRAAGRRPLPLLFRCDVGDGDRQRQSSAACPAIARRSRFCARWERGPARRTGERRIRLHRSCFRAALALAAERCWRFPGGS